MKFYLRFPLGVFLNINAEFFSRIVWAQLLQDLIHPISGAFGALPSYLKNRDVLEKSRKFENSEEKSEKFKTSNKNS